ncbi:hypothetical protein [Anabaena azotica]|uniref:Uncharacterized protein n=1 Tax=Anabaena azotica FACHB-119 TaxID=947527 RepID=A0ABR8DEQ9_9NOST|nr:hypothetical protein [Anabaena azotica]MBD2505129.1 hypothetical protein [Anabaena azotica FACHB-119]
MIDNTGYKFNLQIKDGNLVRQDIGIGSHEDTFSAAPAVSIFYDKDSDDDYTEPVKKSVQPSHQKVQAVLQQLREMPCTQQFRLNWEIQHMVKRYWANVPGAIAYLKEAVRTWKEVKSPQGVFVATCKEGRKLESATLQSDVKDWFEWGYKQRIVIAMSGIVIRGCQQNPCISHKQFQ